MSDDPESQLIANIKKVGLFFFLSSWTSKLISLEKLNT
jgi:hypothetical protein